MDEENYDSDGSENNGGSGGATSEGRQVIILLDLACLETVKTKKGEFELLNCDDHIGIMRKHDKDPQKYRPDIVHQELLAVLDSPLNKAGKVKLYVHTEKNVLIEINSATRLPRTFKRFSGLMVCNDSLCNRFVLSYPIYCCVCYLGTTFASVEN